MDNIQYCQMIIKTEPDVTDPLKPCLSSFELESDVKTEVEGDVCNQSEIQDMKDDSKQDNSNISYNEIIANVPKKVTTTKSKEIEKGRLEKIVENITKKTKASTKLKKGTKRRLSVKKQKAKKIVKSFLSGHKGSLTPIHYKGVVLMKEANQSHYNVKPEDLDRFKKDINGTEMYSCDDCNYTTNYFFVFKIHFMTHANMEFLTKSMNSCSNIKYCFVCDFKCPDSADLDQHISVHRNKTMVKFDEGSDDDSKTMKPTVDNPTIPLDDASIKNESTSPAGSENIPNPDNSENIQNLNSVKDSEKTKQSKKCSTSRKKDVVGTNNGVNKRKKLIVKIREQHVEESEIKPNVSESSGVLLDKKTFTIEVISAAENREKIQNKNTSSGNITKDRRQASRRLKTYSKRIPIVEEINGSKKSEKESSDEKDDYKDYNDSIFSDGNDVQDDDFDPQDTIPLCVVKIENDPGTAAAMCVKDEACLKTTNGGQEIQANRRLDRLSCTTCNFVAKIPAALKRHTCKSYTCKLCGKVCLTKRTYEQHVNSHKGNVIIHLNDKQYQCGVCNVVRHRMGIKYHIHSKHCTPDQQICGLKDCVKGSSVEFICNDCSQKFMSKSALKDHIRRKHSNVIKFELEGQIPTELTNYTGKESHVCQMCGKVCRTKRTYEQHVNSHRGNAIIHLNDKQYQCGVCNIVRHRMGIKYHIHSKHCTADNKICGLQDCIKGSIVEFICNDCSQKFISKSALKDHIDRKHFIGQTYDCNLCEEKFKTRVIMQFHRRNHFCSSCPFQSNSIEETTKHAKAHGHALTNRRKPLLSCELCSYETKKIKHFQWHMFKHKNPKPYSCSQCDYKTQQKGNLSAHERSHLLVTTYSCTLCTFQTNKHSNLLKHKKTHGSEGEVSMIEDVSTRDPGFYYCDRCEYKTKYPTVLLAHERKHDNIRPYLCPVCGATFYSTNTLYLHNKLVHIKPVKPQPSKFYKCSYCDYTYHVKHTVLVHERKHTGVKPHHCDLCTYSTSYMGNLLAHRKKHRAASTASS